MNNLTPGRPARRIVRADHRASVRLPRPVLTPPRVRRRPATRPLWAVLVTILVLGVVLAGRLGQLQLAQHEELAEQAAQVSTRELITPALRGRVLAADGTPLVVNSPTSVVTLDPELLLADDDEALFFEGVEPADEDVGSDAVVEEEVGDGDVGDVGGDVAAAGGGDLEG